MKTYMKTMENRKELVKRLEQLTGERAVYTRMPECAFVIGDYKVEKKGTLVVSDDASMEPLETLLAEGMIIESTESAEAEEAGSETAADLAEDAFDLTEEAGAMAEDAADPDAAAPEEPVAVCISFPTALHTVNSLRNLVSMIRARGNLISKATGGRFTCTEELVEILSAAADIPAFLSTLGEHSGELEGLEITEDKIIFTGFPETTDSDTIQTFMHLAALMNKLALEAKRISPRPVCEDNEKYIFRIWLLRLGMAGPDYAAARRILLTPLSGNAAFKDRAMEDRWKEKQTAKRDALRTARAQQAEESTACDHEDEDANEGSGEEMGSDAVSA